MAQASPNLRLTPWSLKGHANHDHSSMLARGTAVQWFKLLSLLPRAAVGQRDKLVCDFTETRALTGKNNPLRRIVDRSIAQMLKILYLILLDSLFVEFWKRTKCFRL